MPCAVGPRSSHVTGRQGTAARSHLRRPAPGTPGADRRKIAKMHKGWVKRLRRPRASSTMPRGLPQPSEAPKSRFRHRNCRAPTVRRRSTPAVRPECAGAPARGADGGTGHRDQRRNPPAPLPGTDAALTSVLTKEGPRGSVPRGPSPFLKTSPFPENLSGPASIFRLRSYGAADGPLGAALPVGAGEQPWNRPWTRPLRGRPEVTTVT